MAGGDKRRAAKLEEDEAEEDQTRRPDSKSATESVSSDDEEANEDLSLKVVEKALRKRAAMLAENEGAIFDQFRVVRNDADFPCSSSQGTEVGVASTSGFGGEPSGDVKSKKVEKKKKTKIEKVVIEQDEDNGETVENPKQVEEENMNVVKIIEAVDSLESNVGITSNIIVLQSHNVMFQKRNVIKKDEENVVTVENPKPVEGENMDVGKLIEAVDSPESNAANTSTNTVLRKLLRGPRYFDPPDSGWETCYNCGEEGHMAVNCTSASRRKKMCFICGSLDHNVRQCSKAKDCYICRKGGHRAKDCPESFKISKNVKMCLRCGDSRHDMFSCRKEYASDDLKEIQCYVCKNFGHLCCAKYVDTSPREVSCYKCGQAGHIGMVCGKLQGQNNEIVGFESPKICYSCGDVGHFARECQSSSQGLKKEIIAVESPNVCYRCGEAGHFARECQSSSQVNGVLRGQNRDIFDAELPDVCYRCGEAGHFARECRSSSQVSKQNREPSSLRLHSANEKYGQFNSAPSNYGRYCKMKRTKYVENGMTAPRKPKQRGGWLTEDPEEFSKKRSKKSRWNSPKTPYEHHRTFNIHFGDHMSRSQPSNRFSSNQFSASRFGNPGMNEVRRTNTWW